MLAERIKAFLDRIVQDHGSTNLEWLRDVLPDKAKEYLLSIRGLGLKSVECVHLLTLHRLDFAVDVNVGRIAVRLGWVPLQPLSESLQLHLLEFFKQVNVPVKGHMCKHRQVTLLSSHVTKGNLSPDIISYKEDYRSGDAGISYMSYDSLREFTGYLYIGLICFHSVQNESNSSEMA